MRSKTIVLNDGKKDYKVKVYLKKVIVKNNNIATKAFCRLVK
jgi:hypothetical protein